jgi:hypothetical protein
LARGAVRRKLIANQTQEDLSVKKEAPVVKQLYRLNVEPRVVDKLTKLASRTGEPKTRLAARLFTEAVMGFKPTGKAKPGS